MTNHEADWAAPVPGLYGSSFRLGEWITGPVTPLFDDWALPRLEAAMHTTHRGWTGQPAPLPHHVTINGWYFYSLAWLPVTASALLRWSPSLLSHIVRHPRRVAPVIPPTTKYGIGLYEDEWRSEVQPRYLEVIAASELRVEERDAAELPDVIDDLLDLAGEYFAWVTVVGGAAYKSEMQLVRFYHKNVAPLVGGTHLTLLIGLAAPMPASAHAVDTLDWASPTLGERGTSTEPRSAQTSAVLRARREAAERQVREALASSPRKLRKFDELVAEAQRMGPVREEQMGEFTRPWPVLRRALGRIADVLAGSGAIEDSTDVFYLRRSELMSALAGDPPVDLSADIVTRRRSVGDAASLTPPTFVGDVPRLLSMILGMSASQMGVAADTDSVVGFPVSPGIASGPARIVRDPEEFDRLEPGDVLIAPMTAPAWTPLFSRAAAVVTDGGNVFSHASVVAREYGIPAVVGCGNATQRFVDGQSLTVDGSRGTVTMP